MPGPPPKPDGQRRRRNLPMAGSVTRLPAAGRPGEPPPWPLSRALKSELAVWRRLWATPQAVAWEALGWPDVVARYARFASMANERGARFSLLAEVRQLEDRLGLSVMAMARLRWEIVDDQEEPPAVESGILNIRDRLRRGEIEW